jgi:hypothetical protein
MEKDLQCPGKITFCISPFSLAQDKGQPFFVVLLEPVDYFSTKILKNKIADGSKSFIDLAK